ncbi:MAG: hypothetical protein DWH91_02760 [Planctomycetota bacterium]|nr:MAG: hypothetical protein DWH91_02760 [Planctomycetota bacterium]
MRSYTFRTRTIVTLSGAVLFGVGSLLWSGEIADLHRKWVRPKESDASPQMARFEALQSPSHGVSEIGLERAICLGTCPAYSVTFKADGSVRYVGTENVAHKGERTGRISDWEFHRLADFAVKSGYMNMESDYDLPTISDLPVTYSTVVLGEKRKIIRNYGSLGPIELWAFQQSAESLLAEVEWDDERPKSNGDNELKP